MEIQSIAGLLLRLENNPEMKAKIESSFKQNYETDPRVEELYQALVSLTDSVPHPVSKSRPTRIYMAACMDITHSGHFNCMRQAKKLGDILVIGVISDE